MKKRTEVTGKVGSMAWSGKKKESRFERAAPQVKGEPKNVREVLDTTYQEGGFMNSIGSEQVQDKRRGKKQIVNSSVTKSSIFGVDPVANDSGSGRKKIERRSNGNLFGDY